MHLPAVHWPVVLSVQQTLYSFFLFSLRPVACKRKGKLAMDRLHGGGIRAVCVFADHCQIGSLWRRLPDCHYAGFSSLNKVCVSHRKCVDQDIPPHSCNLTSKARLQAHSMSLNSLTFMIITYLYT